MKQHLAVLYQWKDRASKSVLHMKLRAPIVEYGVCNNDPFIFEPATRQDRPPRLSRADPGDPPGDRQGAGSLQSEQRGPPVPDPDHLGGQIPHLRRRRPRRLGSPPGARAPQNARVRAGRRRRRHRRLRAEPLRHPHGRLRGRLRRVPLLLPHRQPGQLLHGHRDHRRARPGRGGGRPRRGPLRPRGGGEHQPDGRRIAHDGRGGAEAVLRPPRGRRGGGRGGSVRRGRPEELRAERGHGPRDPSELRVEARAGARAEDERGAGDQVQRQSAVRYQRGDRISHPGSGPEGRVTSRAGVRGSKRLSVRKHHRPDNFRDDGHAGH
mmetsp:Transcript_17253/g.38894  ORF Transcript_17253/g.38894 Transcript_17253/m.38894 type:complete len:323 (-) Transcript_17253:523-1491(-)